MDQQIAFFRISEGEPPAPPVVQKRPNAAVPAASVANVVAARRKTANGSAKRVAFAAGNQTEF